MSLSDMDFIEVNEAFAAQILANERVLKWDRAKLNVYGGAIALGHPTGISGARILVTLDNILRQHDKELGVAGDLRRRRRHHRHGHPPRAMS